MKVLVADEVESKAVFSLDCETEELAGWKNDAKVWIITSTHLHCKYIQERIMLRERERDRQTDRQTEREREPTLSTYYM